MTMAKWRVYIGPIGAILAAIGIFLPFLDERVWEGAPFVITRPFLPLSDATAFGTVCVVSLNFIYLAAAALLFIKGRTAGAKTISGGFTIYFLLLTYIAVKSACFVGLRFGFWFMALGCAMMLLAPGEAETPT